MREFILCAAIYINDGIIHEGKPENIDVGFVVCGRRHHNCYQTISDLKGDVNTYLKSLNLSDEDYRKHQGFITSLDRYVGREEALQIALDNDQIQYGAEATKNGIILISENLY